MKKHIFVCFYETPGFRLSVANDTGWAEFYAELVRNDFILILTKEFVLPLLFFFMPAGCSLLSDCVQW